MTALAEILRAEITASGPMRLDAFMAACLMHPEHGYYATRDPFGEKGDFITAPEISQMFGELTGLCLAQAWLDQGAPNTVALVELGPGRGTLMADALRATRGVTGFHDALQVHLVETSPALRARQADTLSGHTPTWHDSADTLPDLPTLSVANEFFDALPIRQFQRQGDGWCERVVGLSDDTLALGLNAKRIEPTLAHRLDDTTDGDIVETCPAAAPVIDALARRIAARGGAALVIDYGDWRSLGDTLQAVRGHDRDDILAAPGTADLSAHVDFEALAHAARGTCNTTRLAPQALFLSRLGITQRAEALAVNMSGPKLEAHHAAFHRLTGRDEMGTLFKVMALYPEGAAPPPGLEP
ncbi:class I SAM-dependent methyltransferase [Roseovarius sp. B08]|uniref:class I SAM-dependent methyltransferase n=1 Tax=Roseovarius sp. B08 TaxID=3449223 RepID=UPI003EDC90A3